MDEHDLVVPGGYPGKLKDILGIWVGEQDALPEGEFNSFSYAGAIYQAKVLCDLMHLTGAEMISPYEEDFYQGTPAITKKHFGKGNAYYVGTRSEGNFYRASMGQVFDEQNGKSVMKTPEGVEASVRGNEKEKVFFLLNHNTHAAHVMMEEEYRNLLTGEIYPAGAEICLKGKDVLLLQQGVKKD